VGGVGWWEWPRIDERFVGRWRLSTEKPEDTTSVMLGRDGKGSVVVRKNRVTKTFQFDWRVVGGDLCFYHENRSKSQLWRSIAAHGFRLTQDPMFLGRVTFAVHEASSAFQLVQKGTSTTLDMLPAKFRLDNRQ
jgi:hypothetical protein